MITVLIPTPLQKFTNNQSSLLCHASDVSSLIDSLDSSFPGLKSRLCDDNGNLRRFLNLYVNSEDIRFLDGLSTPLNPGDNVSIVPAVAGG